MSSPVNQSAFLRNSRNFPTDITQLTVEVNKAYVDIARSVNNRVIGFYTSHKSSITGESWFLSAGARKQDALRQFFTFTSTSTIDHGIDISDASLFVRAYGDYTDGLGNNYGLIYGTSVAIAGQISFYLTTTQIIFVTGTGAPALTSGKIILEWITNI